VSTPIDALARTEPAPRAAIAAVLAPLGEVLQTLTPLAAAPRDDDVEAVSDSQVLHHAEPALRQLEAIVGTLRGLYVTAGATDVAR
jgi:hypothetical protein